DKFPNISVDMMDAVDKGDSAQFSEEEILEPTDWVLMNFIMDARTGLGRFRDFKISNYQLMMKLIDACKDHSIEEILQMEDVAERVSLYHEHNEMAKAQIAKCSTVYDNLVVLDLTDQETIYATNRFVIYAMYPDCNISIHKMWGLKKQNVVFAIGKSITNRSSKTNVGELCLKYGGGGHMNAGTCQVETSKAETVLGELIETITSDG
ncbi:MAG: exopolyphosphatase, partial [Pseudomonadota bacterium]|nr:exopolyphosphatase [Pseudomonadota bacterium]